LEEKVQYFIIGLGLGVSIGWTIDNSDWHGKPARSSPWPTQPWEPTCALRHFMMPRYFLTLVDVSELNLEDMSPF
jgi:hypothetical protein